MYRLQVHVSWWLQHYLSAVSLCAALTGLEPDMNRVRWWIARGVSLRLLPVRGVLVA